MMSLRPGKVYTKAQLEKELEFLAASGWFEKVYLEGKTNPDGTIGVKVSSIETTLGAACANVGLVPPMKEVEMDPNMTQREMMEHAKNEERDYRGRIKRAWPCMLPMSVQHKVLEMLREQGKVGAVLAHKIMPEVQKWYHDQGYIVAQVVNLRSLPAKEVVCEVIEGDITQVEVKFQDELGNAFEGKTKLPVIQRELPKQASLRAGHVFNIQAGKQAVRNLSCLKLFSSIGVTPRPDEKKEGVVIVEINLKESDSKSVEVSSKWDVVLGHHGCPKLVELSALSTGINGLNRSFTGSVTRSNFLNPQILEKFEYVHPCLDGVNNPCNRVLRASCFNTWKLSPTFTGGPAVHDVPPIWVDRSGVKAVITVVDTFLLLDLTEQSKFTYGLVMEEIKTQDEYNHVTAQGQRELPGGGITANGPPTTLSGTGVDKLVYAQANITRDNTRSVNGALVGERNVFQVDQGLGIGHSLPFFNRHELTITKFLQLLQVEEGDGKPAPPVLILRGRYAGCVGDLPNYDAFPLGGPYSVRDYNIGELGAAEASKATSLGRSQDGILTQSPNRCWFISRHAITQMLPFYRTVIFLRSHQSHIINRSFQTSSDAYLIRRIEKFAEDRCLLLGKAIHAHLVINGFVHSTHFASKLIAMYSECGELPIARQLFDRIPKTNYRRWIVLIGAYAKCGFYREALNFLREMQVDGVRPNNYVLPSALKACGHLSEWWHGKELHALILRWSFEYDAFVNSALIDMYSKCGFVEKARNVFDGMIEKDLIALNATVAGYVQAGLVKDALDMVESVQMKGFRPNLVTWNTLIAGFSRAGNTSMVDELFQLMRVNGIEPDVVSWTSVISGLVQNFQNGEAFITFKKMMGSGSGCYPTTNTISSLLSACANVANVKHGKEVHGFALMVGLEQDIYVRSALIDMYAKCGCIFQASALFHKMPRRNSPTWNSMIFGYANHGYCDEAIELFKRMEIEDREKLNHLTFTAALTACSHGRRLELGRNLFKSMQENYRISPRLEHYACMVDLLGRGGELTEAYDLIKAMPIEPDLFVWGALLGACKQHGEIELAEVAAKQLSELEPQGAGTRLLSGLYAGAGSWSNAMKLKKLMKKKKCKTFSGCSWVEAS
ncbi:hypothetical protein Cgig2_003923 [Carnegiea gigantea]|uniref:Pentatricopeptide repeat-containing protein n=1 Tax=Carnegiea gigantea TaxID=171969 RepID=A0A9Q1QF49_9CARY|nr:hypothetical protein Cgig2_003923 [Carnegiea gigantea]